MKTTSKAIFNINWIIGSKLLLSCFVVALFFLNTPVFASQQPNAIDPEILKQFEKAQKLFEDNDYEHYVAGNQIITKLEEELIARKNYDQLMYLYLEISYFYVTKFDYVSSKKVLDKVDKILSKHNNYCIRGEYYEHLAVFYNSQGNEQLDEKYTLLSQIFLTQYAPKEKQVDMYYNLTLLYLKKEDWNKTLENSLQFLKTCKETGDNSDQPEINLFIAESYCHLDDLAKSLQYLGLVEKSDDFQHHDEDFLLKSRYHFVLGQVYEKQKKYKEATANFKIATDFFKRRLVYRVVKMNHFLNQKRELEVKNIEFQSIIKQNELKSENVKYKNYLLFVCLITIIILIVLLYFQYRNAKFKSFTNDLLSEKNDLLHKANSELGMALNVKKKLLDTISHELRTPIYTLNGLLHLMEEDQSNYETNIEQLQASVQNLYSLSGNIIEINVIDSLENEYIPKRDVVSLNVLLTKILTVVEKNRKNNNKVSMLVDSKIPEKLLFDEAKLHQVLFSLIDNAFKFTKDGNVVVETKNIEESNDKITVEFIIKDTGIGIDKEIKEKIFDLFYQGSDKINYEYGGSGLGLTLVKKTLSLFNKNLKIDSKPNKGTTVSFSLDFEKYEEINTVPIEAKIIKDPSAIRILLVEDNKTNQLITKKIIIKKGYTCDVVNNGLETCRSVEEADYDLILMDIMMPIMDGFEASDYISKLKPKIPIIALTAISEEVNKELFSASKIKKVLSKPVNIDELYETILLNVNET
ncbi:response regulator [Flavobacterium amnicola]|uniref:histidine kinase n=1 Tax=Flavobacterium amnicola TaxID=2506422 RepID=A0A4Q1K3U8_9FLAO|nr:ATP-binding protein [Flavobacterium amnicola]RXR19071.1 response regulator [Flavobacterium amnicola]